MIPKAALKQYMARPLESHTWVKNLRQEQLWEIIHELTPKPNLYPKLKTHQLACFLLGVSHPQFCYWVDMGCGKSLIILSLLRYWHDCGKLRRAVVFITSDKAFPTWENQIKQYNIGLPYTLLEGSTADKWRAFDEFGGGLILVSYPGATSMLTRTVGDHWELDPEALSRFGENVDALVLDESTRAAGYKSLTHKLIAKLSRTAPVRYALAGRPFNRDPTMLWAQHMLIDKGETLGPTLGLFREAFFTAEQNHFAYSQYAMDYKFDERKKSVLGRMAQHRSITYSAAECDLPDDFLPIVESVRFPQEAKSYYQRAVKSIIASKGNMREVKNIFLRMRQLSSGFVGFKDDETGEKAQVEFADNPKFDRLLELLEDMPSECKAVVFYEFTYSGRKLVAATKTFKPIWLWSGTKDYKSELQRFEHDPTCRIAVINNRVGAFSLDGLQHVANYTLYYESPVSNIDREQSERRLRRQGQDKTVFQYDVIVECSVDAKILAFHKQGQSLLEAVLHKPEVLI